MLLDKTLSLVLAQFGAFECQRLCFGGKVKKAEDVSDGYKPP